MWIARVIMLLTPHIMLNFIVTKVKFLNRVASPYKAWLKPHYNDVLYGIECAVKEVMLIIVPERAIKYTKFLLDTQTIRAVYIVASSFQRIYVYRTMFELWAGTQYMIVRLLNLTVFQKIISINYMIHYLKSIYISWGFLFPIRQFQVQTTISKVFTV